MRKESSSICCVALLASWRAKSSITDTFESVMMPAGSISISGTWCCLIGPQDHSTRVARCSTWRNILCSPNRADSVSGE